MQQECFHLMEERADRHWFFRGRADIVREAVDRRRRGLRVLDVGCGTGHLAGLLRADGHDVVGLEPDSTARAYAARKIPEVVAGDARALSFPDASFDVVVATDVLEHVDDDRAAAREMFRVLRPGGLAVVTVPAFRFLWGPQDVKLGHCRRYTRRSLARTLDGFRIRKLSCYNSILFPAVLAARLLFQALPSATPRDEVAFAPPGLNALFYGFLRLERLLLRAVDFPFGVSLIAVVEKPA